MSNIPLSEAKKINNPLSSISTILVVLGFVLVANWLGGKLMALYLGHMPTVDELLNSGTEALKIKKTLLIGQIGGTVIGLVLLPISYLLFLRKELLLVVFQPSGFRFNYFILLAGSLTIAILPFIGIVGDWNKSITLPESWALFEEGLRSVEERAAQMTKLIVYYQSIPDLILTLFTVALLPAIAEELVFRGILQNELYRASGSMVSAIFFSSVIFSFIHFQFFGFFPRMLLGMALGYLYFTSGNIAISMFMHFLNNALVVIVMNMYKNGTLTIDPESSKDLPIESIFLSVILSSALLYLCWRLYRERTELNNQNV